MSVTIRDVAKAAGVSISTVSRALAKPEQVAENTRATVQEAARKLGYRPSAMARGLITGRTGNIGLVVPDLENPYFGSVCKGVQERARAAGYNVFIADSDEDANLEQDIMRSLAKQVDGIIVCSARGMDDSLTQLAAQSPVVLVNRAVAGLPSLGDDNAGGMRQLVAHLMALGHSKIAYAGGPATSWSNKERLAALDCISGENDQLEIITLGNFPSSFSGGMQSGDLAIASGATAVIGFNDLVAVGLLERLRQRGISVPGEISVVGFDNIPVSSHVWPGLTTVDCPRVQLGRASVDMLLDAVLGREGAAALEVGAELVIRQSTGVVPGRPTPE